ncbi:DUF2827 family protein [Variovorax sp. Sphag1AA]|uniref:DUF2827 family protein n=1 Tax=Variovorax sp. Sphag1AA TaxID=2587027 RepID=UPI00161750A6|nr:DUF2827 family protein [Variovorax sp. Sphag1AA]MBB3180642.1 hypothetical protein [Variovorax sp. Sphag1AA]
MHIGISVCSREGQRIWADGLGQNVLLLAQLFQNLSFVQSVSLIDVGTPGAALPAGPGQMKLRRLTVQEATKRVDVIVEMAGALDPQWVTSMRSQGKKVVYVCCGHPYAGLIEPIIPGRPSAFSRADRCDEVWVLPKDSEFAPMLRLLHRCPVHVVPFIWSPRFAQARIDEVEQLGQRFGYRTRDAEDEGWRVAVFVPATAVVKTSIVAMVAGIDPSESMEGSVKVTHVLNTLHARDYPATRYFASSADLFRQHKAIFHGSFDIVGFMAEFADAVIAHGWENDQDYSYLDVLYGDYPLIHNSTWLADAGYYYEDERGDAAGSEAQLRRAIVEHDSYLDEYRMRTRRVIASVDPLRQDNLDVYAERLLRLRAL